MGGYGGASGRFKGKCYYDTGNRKVIDKNAIEAAEYYIREGKYVAFLKQNPPDRRPDLSIDRELLVEVKGMSSTIPHKAESNIKKAFEQIASYWSHYPEDERHPGKVVILSRHESFEEAYNAVREGFKVAKARGYVHGPVEFWYHGQIHVME